MLGNKLSGGYTSHSKKSSGSTHRICVMVFITLIYNLFNTTLNDHFRTFIAWKKCHVHLLVEMVIQLAEGANKEISENTLA